MILINKSNFEILWAIWGLNQCACYEENLLPNIVFILVLNML